MQLGGVDPSGRQRHGPISDEQGEQFMPDGEFTTTVEATADGQFIGVVHDEHGVERHRTPPLPTRTAAFGAGLAYTGDALGWNTPQPRPWRWWVALLWRFVRNKPTVKFTWHDKQPD